MLKQDHSQRTRVDRTRSALLGCGCSPQPPHAGGEASNANPLKAAHESKQPRLALDEFHPRSSLKVKVSRVDHPAFPVIDAHVHLSWMKETRAGVSRGEDMQYFGDPAELVQLMDRKGIRAMVNLTGGVGRGLRQTIARFDKAAPGRFFTLTEPSFHLLQEPDYPQRQADALVQAHHDGARGLKLLKTLGLYLREQIDTGPLVALDDARFDPMWEACAGLYMPVFIHCADPPTFFQSPDVENERYEELSNHPDWSFCGPGFPSFQNLMDARAHVIDRHPRTTFVLMHVGNQATDLDAVESCMQQHANVMVDISARIAELGRQPRRSRRFIEQFQDRVLFGTDAVPPPFGNDVPQQLLGDALYDIYYRFLETEDEYFDYAPTATPPQGRWRIYGLGLPRPILRKIYADNAARVLGLDA